MASTRARDRYRGNRRPPSRSGVYATCRRCRGRGYKLSKGVRMYCAACAGDGLVRVGAKKRPGGRAKRRSGSSARRVAAHAASAGALYGGLGYYLGTIGQVLAVIIIVLVVVLRVVAAVLRTVARVR